MSRPRQKIPSPLVRLVKAIATPRNTGLFLVLLGISLFSFPSVYRNIVSSRISENQGRPLSIKSVQLAGPIRVDDQLLTEKAALKPPVRIIIPKYSLNLPIVEAKVVNGFWELSETTASHGTGSANPGGNGNIVIFAHARDNLFGPLRKAKKDDQIYILTEDKWYKYLVAEIKEVNPDQIEVIAPTTEETLTLYTCTGFLDGKRLIVKAKLISQ